MTRFPLHHELPDGSVATIRPIEPSDKGILAAGFERLSRRSRHRRFLGPMRQLTPQQLAYLTEVDGRDHAALIADVRRGRAHLGGGIGRYVRDPDRPDAAELALAVTDEQQSMGLGTRLLVLLAGVARSHGIRRFTGHVQRENGPMRALLDRFGAELRADGDVLRIELDVERITGGEPPPGASG